MGVDVEMWTHLVWSAEPPRAGEWDAPEIIGWAFRGTFVPPEQMESYVDEQATSTEPRPLSTSKRGVVLELMVTGPDGLPLWVQFRQHLFGFHGLRGEWCPVRIGEPISRTS